MIEKLINDKKGAIKDKGRPNPRAASVFLKQISGGCAFPNNTAALGGRRSIP